MTAAKKIVFTDRRKCPRGILKTYSSWRKTAWPQEVAVPSVLKLVLCIMQLSKIPVSKAFHDSSSGGMSSFSRSNHDAEPCFDPCNANFHFRARVRFKIDVVANYGFDVIISAGLTQNANLSI